jgi:EmrB/QacA subfamily drug resistance transporter
MKRPAAGPRIPHLGLLVVMAVAEFMLTLDLSIVNVALPAIRADLGFSSSSLQWVVNGYALTFAGFLLLGGRATDLFGGRRVFLGALGAFVAASLACGLAANDGTLVGARVIQGISAGILAPATLSILTTTYQEPEARRRALAVWTAVAIGGGAVGGLLGGLLTDALSWRWVFFVNVPVGALLLAVALRRVPPTRRSSASAQLDLGGAIAVTGGLTALVWALIRSDAAGWGSGEVMLAFVLAAALLGAFVIHETRTARAPLVPFSVFRSRPLAAGNLLSFLSFAPVMATWFFLTLYLQAVRGYAPIETGLLFLPLSLAVIGGSQLGFRLLARTDARVLFPVGGLIAAGGLAWLGQLGATTDLLWVILPASAAMLGGGLMFAPIMVAATSGVAPEMSGLASGLLNTTRQIGGALGLALLGTIAAAQTGGGSGAAQAAAVSSGFAVALEVGAVIYVATAIVGALVLPTGLGGSPTAEETTPDRDTRVAGERVGRARSTPVTRTKITQKSGIDTRARAPHPLGTDPRACAWANRRSSPQP